MTEHEHLELTKTVMLLKGLYMLSWAVIQCGYIIAWTLTSIEFAGGPCKADDALGPVMTDIQKHLDDKLKEATGENKC